MVMRTKFKGLNHDGVIHRVERVHPFEDPMSLSSTPHMYV